MDSDAERQALAERLMFGRCAYCDRRVPYPRTTCAECQAVVVASLADADD